jgi:hypothetical protein
VPAYCEQTGGGCATIFVGEAKRDEDGDHFLIAIGPGWFAGPGWRDGRFSWGELYVGPDTPEGDGHGVYVHSLVALRAHLREQLGRPDWRDEPAPVLAP